ncbi:lysyl oxidase family protein [Nocardioides alcanivorans]|uniref:lysyl oxidase family protein n=1 Tax=Nocardioides alcanivorans TaxID=2897352 RepID=UPI001F3C46C9|nr:lysyl oxidase family protein [Nocardioides alcanivorans]
MKRLGFPIAALATLGLVLPGAAHSTGQAAHAVAPDTAADSSPLVLKGAKKAVVYTYGKAKRAEGDYGLALSAPDAAMEIRTHRADWKSPLTTVWHSPDGEVALPDGIQKDWDGLSKFLKVEVRNTMGKLVQTKKRNVCLNSWSTQRSNPDAPLRNPYPDGCPYNPFTIGSVQGIQQGWISNVSEAIGHLKVGKGKYDVTATITPKWRKALGISASDATHTFRLVVKKWSEEEEHAHRTAPRTQQRRTTTLKPAAKPTADSAGAPAGPLPDLQSIPAYGIGLSRNGKNLRFSATVWNAGNSPMLVDGFRRGNKDIMDAYQYFVDADGNQTGYEKVGTMIWHKAATHNHWHFEDFARYTLLRADKTEAVRSRKESFCLANTDAIDYTVDGADWRPDNTDLATDCGDRSSVSLREVLAAGSGDTYAQFRAGQAFRVNKLPNGVYYIAVEGNPEGNLVESDTTNNVALRKVKLSGKGANRKVKVFPVGIIDDSGYSGDMY